MEFSAPDGNKVSKTPGEMYREALTSAPELIPEGQSFSNGVKSSAKDSLTEKIEAFAKEKGMDFVSASGLYFELNPKENVSCQ
jgi:hypothetical protein